MKSSNTSAIVRDRSIALLALAVGLVLLIPLVAMQFTGEVDWNVFDFVVAGALLFGAGLAYQLIARGGDIVYRAAIGLAVATALLLVWANLAVGIIGSENERANGMYIGVLAVLIIGAVIARFHAPDMVRVLFATALAQALIAASALIAGMDEYAGSSVREILMVNGFFIALWVGSALLFRRAGGTTPQLLKKGTR